MNFERTVFVAYKAPSYTYYFILCWSGRRASAQTATVSRMDLNENHDLRVIRLWPNIEIKHKI